jgi:hypothetical protein
MTHYCIKYRLNADGTVPNLLCLHPEGVGGVFGVATLGGTTQHNDTVFIGLSENSDYAPAELVPTQADLEAYLTSVSSDWTQSDPTDPDTRVPFDPIAAASWVWARLEALNGETQ